MRVEWSRQVDETYDYYADDSEAVVYMIMESGRNNRNCLYVMRRADAVAFCNRPETCGRSQWGGMWGYAFTTYRRDWRKTPQNFRSDDGRFDALLQEMGIVPIYRGGQPVPLAVIPNVKQAPRQLSLFTC